MNALIRFLRSPHVLVYLVYLAVALLITFPAVLTASTHVMGGETGDNYEMLRHIWWFKYALQNGQPLYYQPLLNYPQGFSSLILSANQLQFLPMYLFAFIMPLALAYNVTLWLTMALNGWATYWLARALFGENATAPAFISGLVYLASPLFQGHLFDGHAGLMVSWGLPFFVWALVRLIQAESHVWRWGILAIISFNLTPSGHMLQVIYVLMPVISVVLLWRLSQNDWRGIWRVGLVCVGAGAFMGVFLLPMIQETLATPAYTETGGVVRYSADFLSLVSPSPFHPLWGQLGYNGQVLGLNLGEGMSYIGVFVAFFVLWGAWHTREARWLVGLMAVAWVLSMGSLLKVGNVPVTLHLGDYETYVPLPWALVQDVTGFSLARTPARFNFTTVFAIALLAGYGVRLFWAWGIRHDVPRRFAWGSILALSLGILGDYQSFFPLPTRPTDHPQAIIALRDDPSVRAVFDMPYEHLLGAKEALFYQIGHEKPLIAGQITRQTPVSPAKLALLQHHLRLLQHYADVVIFHKVRAREIKQYEAIASRLSVWGAPLYEDERIAIYRVPKPTAPLVNVLTASAGGTFDTAYTTDLYTTTGGWAEFSATVSAESREVVLYLDETPYHRWTIDGTETLSVPLPIEQSNFYRVSLRLDPPCLPNHHSTLACRALTVNAPSVRWVDSTLIKPFIAYQNGVTLVASSVKVVGETLEIRLWWRFENALTADAVRFVHVLNAQGANLAQSDEAIGATTREGEWTETIRLSLRDVPQGLYSVRVGWYDFPTLARFRVQDNLLFGARDNAPQIATFER